MSRNTGLLEHRCNPYGEETGGPKHVGGGQYGPEYAGKIHWVCESPAPARYRMACPQGHTGQAMWLCDAHRREIQKRQAGLCPRCAWPDEARSVNERIEWAQVQLSMIGPFLTAEAVRWRQVIEECKTRMDELSAMGMIQKNPLRLIEVS